MSELERLKQRILETEAEIRQDEKTANTFPSNARQHLQARIRIEDLKLELIQRKIDFESASLSNTTKECFETVERHIAIARQAESKLQNANAVAQRRLSELAAESRKANLAMESLIVDLRRHDPKLPIL